MISMEEKIIGLIIGLMIAIFLLKVISIAYHFSNYEQEHPCLEYKEITYPKDWHKHCIELDGNEICDNYTCIKRK